MKGIFLQMLLPALGKVLADLFGNKTRTGLTSAGTALVALLIAFGVNPQLATSISTAAECVGAEAVKYQQQQEQAKDHAGDSDSSAGVWESGGHDRGSGVYGRGPGEMASGSAAAGPYEHAPAAAGIAPYASAVMLSGWPWNPPPVPARGRDGPV